MSDRPARKNYDVIVIGAGHNGLVTAAYLAKAGYTVMVLERRPALGGAAGSEALFPGYRVDTGAFDAGLFLPRIVSDLGLERFGLEFNTGPAVAFAPQPDGRALALWRDPARTQAEIARFSPVDAGKYPAFARQVSEMAGLLDEMRTLAPPTIPKYRVGELLPWARVALQLRRQGEREMMEFLRVLPIPVSQFLDEWFESPALKGVLGSAGVLGSLLGPRGSGTALMLLYQSIGGDGGLRASRFVRGGMGKLAEALAGAARERGAEICTGLGVAEILLEEGAATGVTLDSGEQVRARAVISNASPQRTFFNLVGAPHLGVRFVREVKNIKARGCLARVTLALRDLPRFSGIADVPGGSITDLLSGHILISTDLDYLERAYDEAKYGQLSTRPFLDAAIPTVLDPALAPAGEHLMVINVQYTPYRLREGDWDGQRESLGDRVVATLAEYAPGIQDLILDRQVMTPLDLERSFGLPEGDIYHGQMGLDQLLFMRPTPGYSRYHTPVPRLFLCGSGAHPGGGVTGAPGYNAARAVVAFLKGRG